jgi:hypothetical protein
LFFKYKNELEKYYSTDQINNTRPSIARHTQLQSDWTPEEEQILMKEYPKHKSDEFVAGFLDNKTEEEVRYHRSKWSSKEDSLLEQNWPQCQDDTQVASFLPLKNEDDVYRRRRILVTFFNVFFGNYKNFHSPKKTKQEKKTTYSHRESLKHFMQLLSLIFEDHCI